MPKIVTAKEAAEMIKPHDRIMVGGFLAVGYTENLVNELIETGTKDIHLIGLSTDYVDWGVGKLVTSKQVKSVQVSHIGTNKNTQAQMNAGEIDVELVPQGTLMERCRAAGAGLGGILTPTGIGTVVEEGKQVINLKGKDYILEEAIEAEYAFVRALKADKNGNLVYYKTARNSNPIMAMAAKTTIVEVDEIVEVGEIPAEDVITPGIFVDFIVKHEE